MRACEARAGCGLSFVAAAKRTFIGRYTKATDVAGESPPSEAWPFAQAILGRPFPRVVTPETKARTHRTELQGRARFSFWHGEDLRRLQSTEANARRDRELLEWAAQFSAGAERKLRTIQQIEAREARAWHVIERFAESDSLVIEWDEADHPRAPKGTPIGALVAFDTAGNAVGLVQGVYNARQNGVNIANGAQIAGGLLGLGANAKSARDLGRAAKARHAAEIDGFVKKLPRKATPTRTPADLYEVKHTGPHNYELSGGGVKYEIDGYRGSTILEAKHVDKPNSSPYVPGSTCPEVVPAKILSDTRDRLKKAATIIKSGSTPFKSVEIITNTPASKKLFEKMLKEIGLPGTVRLEP